MARPLHTLPRELPRERVLGYPGTRTVHNIHISEALCGIVGSIRTQGHRVLVRYTLEGVWRPVARTGDQP